MIGYHILIEIDALDSNNNPITLRFAGRGGYNDGVRQWSPGIIDPGLYQVDLFGGGRTYGASTSGYGEVIINNLIDYNQGEGPVDYLNNYKFEGRGIRSYIGPLGAIYPAGFTRAYTAIIQNPTIGWEQVSFTLKSRQSELDIPFGGEKFLGNNVLPNGKEGTAADLKDKFKPIVVGRAFNFSPALCNTSKMIYALSPKTGISIEEFKSDFEVFDNGVRLNFEATVADVENYVPQPGHYAVSLDGYMRIGNAPVGQITCSGVQRGKGLVSSPARLIEYVLNNSGFSTMKNAASFNAHTALDNYERGKFCGNGEKISQIIDEILSPLGYWYFNRDGEMVLGQLQDPSTMNSVFSLISGTNIKNFNKKKAADTKGGVPASKVTIRYAKNNTVQKQAAGSIKPERRTWLSEEYRTATQAGVGPVHPLSEEMVIDTSLTEPAFLTTLANLYTVKREILEIDTLDTTDIFLQASAIQPGQCVTLDLQGRFGYAGKKMVVIGILTNYVDETVKFTLWG